MSASPTISPYIGLVPYSEKDAPFFFGRDAETEIISANLMAARLTLLYGASGVGKSSVLRAGVAHHLRAIAHQNLIERGSPEFAVATFSAWRDDPIVGLVNAIQEAVSKTWEGKPFEPIVPSLDLAQTLEAGAKSAGGELILILDQFEEYFLYHSQEDGAGTFAVEFPRVVNRTDLRASFLISTREDALAKLDRFKGRIPNLFDNYLRIEHLDHEAARDAIIKPLEEYNRRTIPAQAVKIEPPLVDTVLGQVKAGQVMIGDAGRGALGGVASSERIETPYLQLVMTRLWDEERRAKSQVLRRATLTRLGGAERIVRTHLDAAMNALPSGDQNVASHIFRYLVTPSGTKIAHTAPDLASYTELPLKQVTPCLDKLASGDVRILRPVAPPIDQPQVARYEIYHDVLAAAIMDWRERYQRNMQRRRLIGIVGVFGVFVLVVILALSVYAAYTNMQLAEKSKTVQEQAVLVSVSNQKIDSQATAESQQAAVAQQNATVVSQLQVAVQTLAPVDTPIPVNIVTPSPTKIGGTPAKTSTPDGVATATAAARATADTYARATAAAQATKAAQTLQLIVTPSPRSACVVSGVFANTWLTVASQIGCASGNAISGFIAEETFQKGKMFWREPIDAGQVVGLYNDSTWQILKAGDFTATDPEFSCPDKNTPSQSPPTPRRGFGKAWCNIAGVRDRMGNATDAEWGYTNWMQQFDRGFMLRVESGDIYVFYSSTQRWVRLPSSAAK